MHSAPGVRHTPGALSFYAAMRSPVYFSACSTARSLGLGSRSGAFGPLMAVLPPVVHGGQHLAVPGLVELPLALAPADQAVGHE
jgi:hypothetical protein